MHSAKDFFISALGVSVPMYYHNYDIMVQRVSESTPFCIIKTQHDGSTILRVNSWEDEDDDSGITLML